MFDRLRQNGMRRHYFSTATPLDAMALPLGIKNELRGHPSGCAGTSGISMESASPNEEEPRAKGAKRLF
jgi:hypothetical protein